MRDKSGTNKGFHISLFYVIYLVVVVAVCVAVMYGLKIVRNRMAEYEAAQPKYVVEEVFTRYFDPINYTALLAEADYDAAGVSVDDLMDYLNDEIGGEQLTYSVGSSNDPDEIRYIVKAGSKQLAAIMLKTGSQMTEHGFQTYDFSRIELYLNMEAYLEELSRYLEELSRIVVTFDVPVSYSVTVDGELLTADFLTDTYTRENVMTNHPPDVPEIEYAVYTITTLHELPEDVAVISPEGIPAQVSFDESTCTYTCDIVYDEALEAEYSEFVINAIEKYAIFVHKMESPELDDIKSYFDTSSDTYADMVAARNDYYMVRAWLGIDFEDVNVGEFYAHTPEIFSCRISLTQVLHRTNVTYTDVIDMYVFLHLTNHGYKIYGLFNA